MEKLIRLVVAFAIVMTSCQKVQEQDTAVLSDHTRGMVDYFLYENKGEGFTKNKILVLDCSYDEMYVIMKLCCHDTSILKPFGRYNGKVHYKRHDILLFGDSWNDFFWTCDTIYDIPSIPSDNWGIFYDPTEWNVCIRCKDTTITEAYSEFPYNMSNPMSYTEYSRMLCDSLQKIINPK